MKYQVARDPGVDVNGELYATGHVFDLDENQVASEPFASYIEASDITAVEAADESKKDEGSSEGSSAGEQSAEGTQEGESTQQEGEKAAE